MRRAVLIVAAWIFAAGGLAACRARGTLEPMGSGGAGGPTSIGPARRAGSAGAGGWNRDVRAGRRRGSDHGGRGYGSVGRCRRRARRCLPRRRRVRVPRPLTHHVRARRRRSVVPRLRSRRSRERWQRARGLRRLRRDLARRSHRDRQRDRRPLGRGLLAPVQSFVRAWRFADCHSPLGRRRLRQRRLRRRRMVGRAVGRRGGPPASPQAAGQLLRQGRPTSRLAGARIETDACSRTAMARSRCAPSTKGPQGVRSLDLPLALSRISFAASAEQLTQGEVGGRVDPEDVYRAYQSVYGSFITRDAGCFYPASGPSFGTVEVRAALRRIRFEP